MTPWILLVDDDPAILELLGERLGAEGFRTTTAEDAKQALIQAESVRPSLVIMDVQMPGFGTGLDALAELRAHPRLAGVPVIILTGMSPDQVKPLLAQDTRTRYLQKPPDWPTLIRLAHSAVPKKH
ncbi:MAG: response regulator [Elusimicrobia bacterium]|nr:response regulator [Elusimicrobiota bacterium]